MRRLLPIAFRAALGGILLLLAGPGFARNLLTNGGFEDGLEGWSLLAQNGGSATYTAVSDAPEGVSALRIEATTLGANPWSLQAISSPWSAQVGTEHTITFRAKAAVVGARFRLVIQDGSFGNQQSRDQTLSTDWTHYTWTLTPGAASMNFVLHFFETGTFWLDDVRIARGDGSDVPVNLVLDAGQTHQTMVGFGGALTWYADRVFRSPHRDAINQLIFEDLGMDILRLKNWYFPSNYPTNKDPTGMADATMWRYTTDFYNLAKAADPAIKVLYSSWGPPAALKSNNSTREGTLKKVDGAFVYDQYAQYWVDTFAHLPFIPDYLSIQNEPGYTNPGWTTCVWRPTETADFPGYAEALDLVHEALRDLPRMPLIVGAEVENIGSADWDGSENLFRAFTTPLQSRDYVHAYAYHLYNIWALNRIDAVIPNLQLIRDEFSDRPNFMTEYSREFAGWLETARIIQNSLIEANTAAYIHWNLVWAPASDPAEESAMIAINNAGAYTVGENYYALKHFSKFIDEGYLRVSLSGSDTNLRVSAFLRPDGRRLVVQAVNAGSSARSVNWDLDGAVIAAAEAIRSTEGNLYAELGAVEMTTETSLPAQSLTTYILDLQTTLRPVEGTLLLLRTSVASGSGPVSLTVENRPGVGFSLWKAHDLDGQWSPVSDAQIAIEDSETTLTDPTPGTLPVFYEIRGSY
jgi:O-glycosyl hydrolase